MNNEATYRFAFAATRRFAGPTKWAVVRELNASGYPLHLPLSYMGELPNSHGRTSTGKSYDLHGIRTLFPNVHYCLSPCLSFCPALSIALVTADVFTPA